MRHPESRLRRLEICLVGIGAIALQPSQVESHRLLRGERVNNRDNAQ